MDPCTISSINRLPLQHRREVYLRLIPKEIIERLAIPPSLVDALGRDLLDINCPTGCPSAEMSLYHQAGFPDPVLYGHITDTVNGQIHVLLYILNDPNSERFDTDRLPDGTPTQYGTSVRNLEAEIKAKDAGLAPGQVRRGLRLLGATITAFEQFVVSLGQDMYFVDPLHYHNAVIFERYGFAYERGLRLMKRIQAGFDTEGDLVPRLDSSTPFRTREAANSIRLRSWAIHDGLLDTPFDHVTMYKRVGKSAGVDTCGDINW